MHKTSKFTLLLLLLAAPLALRAEVLFPQANAVPGGIAIVKLDSTLQPAPAVYYGKRRVLVRRNSENWEAVVGIPLSAKASIHDPLKEIIKLLPRQRPVDNSQVNIDLRMRPHERQEIIDHRPSGMHDVNAKRWVSN